MRFILYIFIAIISLVSCGRESINSDLDRVKEMADSGKAREAKNLLDSLHTNFEFNESEQMYHDLLEIKISDKMDIVPENDSTILKLLDYYIEKGNDKNLHPLVLYYAGRTYAELKDTPKALRYFHQSLDCLNEGEESYLKCCLYSQIGGLFHILRLNKYALRYFKKELEEEYQMNDSTNAIITKIRLTSCHRELGNRDSVIKIFKELSREINSIEEDRIKLYFSTQLASFFLEEDNYNRADSIINALEFSPDFYDDSIFAIINEVENKFGKSKSVKARSLRIFSEGNIYSRRRAADHLAKLYFDEGDLKNGLSYARVFKNLSDSINAMEATDYLAQMEAIYDYSEREKQNQELRFENRIVKRNIIICVVVIIILACLMVIFYLRHRLRIANLKLRIEETRSEGERLLKGLESDNNRLREKAKAMETRLNSEERNERVINRQIALSDVSRMIIRKGTSPDEKVTPDDFSRLERALGDLYPGFLDKLQAIGLREREFHDALLIAIKVPLKICANMLNISASGLANSRTRLLRKKAPDSTLSDWSAYISSLRDSCAPSQLEDEEES